MVTDDASLPIDVGSRLEPFVDHVLIDHMEHADLRLNHPVPREKVFAFDAPWEGDTSAYVNVFHDGEKYRMYYRGSADAQGKPPADPSAQGKEGVETTCVAFSDDGVYWTRPDLGIHSFAGSKDNNIVWMGDGSHCFFVFKDANPDAGFDQTYKALAPMKRTPFFWTSGLFPLVSPDGFHWSVLQDAPVITRGGFDSQNVVFWDAEKHEYACYLRDAPDGVRGITRTSSPDFLHWSEPRPLRYTGAPLEPLYTNAIAPYGRAPHLYLGFPMRFRDEPKIIPSHRYSGVSDGAFMASRDGLNFHRWPEAFLRPGPDPDNWTDRNTMAAHGLLELRPGELSLYYSQHYEHHDNYLVRATIRTDGFASIHAGAEEAIVVTKNLVFSGKELVLNVATSAFGYVRVEIQNPQGQPLTMGVNFECCRPILGDEIERVVRWKFGTDLAPFAGKPIRLAFRLRDADIFALRFRP